jgi:predicted transposase/invertase (TIGR01784 family)
MKPRCDPKVDYAFKHVFGREQSKPVLMSLIDAVLQPAAGEQITSLELLNPFNDKETLDDKLSILDIKARDESGRQFNIEMQMLADFDFRQRALYYWSRLHQSQLQEGMAYHELKPTIAICFMNTPLFPEIADHHLVFDLRERQYHELFTDQLQMHILELPKFNKQVEQLATPLDRWLYFLRHAQALDADALPALLDMPDVRWAMRDLMMITQSEIDRERYESRLKAQFDAHSRMVNARDALERGLQQGLQQGRQQGRQEGRQEGRLEGRQEGRLEGRAEGQIARIQSFQRLLRKNLSTLEDLRALALDDLESLAARLEAELSANLANDS